MRPSLIDTHCHLEMKAFQKDREEVLSRAANEGIAYIINAGSDERGNIDGLRIAAEHEQVYASVGIHPHDAESLDTSLFKNIRAWIQKPKVVAIGEIGLDYHYLHSSKEAQINSFRKQLALARESDLPVIVHSREARDDTLRILGEEGKELKGVLHCFSGDQEMANTAVKMGFHISFAGPVTFKNAGALRKTAKTIPDERILVETDAPYLSPVPMRGKRNEPSYVRYTAQALADVRGVSEEDIARIVTLNAKMLFSIGPLSKEGKIAYRIRDSLYLNITDRCTNRCGFCVKGHTSYIKGHNLKLVREPTDAELITAIGDPRQYKEIVFCGLGEPFLRLDLIKTVAQWVKERGGKVRVNTNGHGNAIHGRNILPELRGIVDIISVSLDAEKEETYQKICRPVIKDAFLNVISFIKESKIHIPKVNVTIVNVPGVNITKCREIARDLGVDFRVRDYNVVG